MEYTLTHLIDSLQSALKVLKGDANAQLLAQLHDHDRLPSKKIAGLASQAVDLLHETEQLLEPGPLVLADHFLGYVNSKCLTAAVQLDVPDILHAGPKQLSDLAVACHANPDRLGQILRVLYNNGIFAFDKSSGTYRNNSTSQLLLTSHWTQWRNWVDLYGNEFYDMARGIPASCREDEIRMPAQINFDTDLDMFRYFTHQGWLPRLHLTLGGGAIAQAPGILEDYPWQEIGDRTFLDIGGGTGGLVALVLRKHLGIQAGILDLPEVIDYARTNFHSSNGQYLDVGDRVSEKSLIAGDFLVEIPRFEIYTMKWCLHDWDDSKAMKILSNIRTAIIKGEKSRLVIFESMLTDGRMGRLSRYGDITMMVSAKGQERDEARWRFLAEQTGWKVSKIYPLRNSWPCAIEFVPFWIMDSDLGDTKLVEEAQLIDTSHTDPKSCGLAQNKGDVTGQGRSYVSQMSFLEPWDVSRGEPFFRSAPDKGFESTNLKWVDHSVTITDARPDISAFDLDREGFAFYKDQEGLGSELLDALRSNDKEIIRQLYFPRIEQLVRRETGASRVITFDSTVRKRNPKMDQKENPNGQEQPATVASALLESFFKKLKAHLEVSQVHCDQSTKGALRRLQQNLGEDEDISSILKRRVKMINVWRPLRGPVDNWPLAMMAYPSLSASNVHPCNLWRHRFEERGQTVAFSYADDQRWYYLDGHGTDEVTMIKIWDNDEGVIGKFCPHAAFAHPDSPPGAVPRESVEARCFAIWE